MRYPSSLRAGLSTVACAILAACGGGGSSLPDAVASPVVAKVAQISSIAPLGSSFIASATVTSQPNAMQKMSWSVMNLTAGTPDLTVNNADCAAGSRSSRTLNGITQSNWACDAVLTTPTVLSADAVYRVTFIGTDINGNTSTDYSDVHVAAGSTSIALSPPVVSTQAALAVNSGADVGLSCFATGGSLKAGSRYVFSWVIKSNPAGLPLSLAPAADGSLAFKAPVVSVSTPVTLQCRVTDDNLATTVSDSVVTISPTSGVIAVANPGSTQTVAINSIVTIDGSSSSAPGNPVLYYKWVQIEGPVVSLSSADVAKASFTAPIVADTTRLAFNLVVSTKFPVDPASAAPSEQSTLAVFVTPQPPLTLAVSSSSSVKGSVPVSMNVSATPVSGSTLYYGWSQISGPSVTLGGANTASASFVSPNVMGSPVELLFAVNVSRKPLSEALPSEIVSSDVVVQVNP